MNEDIYSYQKKLIERLPIGEIIGGIVVVVFKIVSDLFIRNFEPK